MNLQSLSQYEANEQQSLITSMVKRRVYTHIYECVYTYIHIYMYKR